MFCKSPTASASSTSGKPAKVAPTPAPVAAPPAPAKDNLVSLSSHPNFAKYQKQLLKQTETAVDSPAQDASRASNGLPESPSPVKARQDASPAKATDAAAPAGADTVDAPTTAKRDVVDVDNDPVVQERMKRLDNMSSILGQHMVRRWTLLGDSCRDCNAPLMRHKEKGTWCVICERMIEGADDKQTASNGPAPTAASAVDQEATPTPAEAKAEAKADAARPTSPASSRAAARATVAAPATPSTPSHDEDEDGVLVEPLEETPPGPTAAGSRKRRSNGSGSGERKSKRTTFPSDLDELAASFRRSAAQSAEEAARDREEQRIQDALSSKMLYGWVLTGHHCPRDTCNCPLVQSPRDQTMLCVSCNTQVVTEAEFDPAKHRAIAVDTPAPASATPAGKPKPKPTSTSTTSTSTPTAKVSRGRVKRVHPHPPPSPSDYSPATRKRRLSSSTSQASPVFATSANGADASATITPAPTKKKRDLEPRSEPDVRRSHGKKAKFGLLESGTKKSMYKHTPKSKDHRRADREKRHKERTAAKISAVAAAEAELEANVYSRSAASTPVVKAAASPAAAATVGALATSSLLGLTALPSNSYASASVSLLHPSMQGSSPVKAAISSVGQRAAAAPLSGRTLPTPAPPIVSTQPSARFESITNECGDVATVLLDKIRATKHKLLVTDDVEQTIQLARMVKPLAEALLILRDF